MTEEKNMIFQDYRKVRNKYEHLQERFSKSQKDLNDLERGESSLKVAIAKLQKLNLLERILNRLPEEIKQLTEGKEE